ncbi:ABC transporter permease OS=Streptomyces alboniger OX=132473 GN=CP975_27065 PE=4 SV=1 [Streptomyces alboniger]
MRGRGVPAAVRGSRHHGLVLGAAGLAVLLAATVLAALAALSEKSVEGAAQRRLAADRDAVVEIAGPFSPDGAAELDRAARAALARTYGDLPQHTWPALRAPAARNDELAVTEAAGHPRRDATLSVVAPEGVRRHAALVAGRWPRFRAGAVEAALTETAAAELAVRPGDPVVVRGAGERLVRLEVVGLYAAQERAPAVWASLSSTFGAPDTIAVVPRRAFAAQPGLAGDAAALWLGVPDADGLRLGEIEALRERSRRFAGSDPSLSVLAGRSGDRAGADGRDLTVSAGLRRALDRLTTPIAVARAGLYVPATLLAALAVAALVLTARQLAEHRRPELALLAARGAGTRRLVLATAALWACAAVPAAVAAPFLAGPLLRGLAAAGLVEGELPGSAVTGSGWAAALAALLVHGAAVLLPTARAVRDRRAVARLRLRVARFAAAQRFGADLALAAVAVLGWLQLRQYRSPVTGGNGVDPVLVLAPVTMTVAAALLALRFLPLLARVIDPLARRGSGLALPLGGWQIGRRAARHAGPALVVTLALAVAALSSTALAILDRGDRDQAAFQVGADLRVEPGEGLPAGERRARYEALPGAEAVTPVITSEGYVGQDAVAVTAVNTARGPVPELRGDLADAPVRELMGRLGRGIPEHGLPVRMPAAGGAEREVPLRVRMSATGRGDVVPVRLTVFYEDADGLGRSGSVVIEEGRARTVPLRLAARGTSVRVLQIELSMVGERVRRTYRLTVDRVPGLRTPARWRDLRADAPDRGVAGCPGAEPGPPGERASRGDAPGPVLCRDEAAAGTLVDAVLRGPDGRLRHPTWGVRLGTDRAEGRPAAPVLADDLLLASGAVRVGDTVTLRRGTGGSARVRVVGRVAGVPGAPRDRPRLLADSRWMAAQWAFGGALPGADAAWWVGVGGNDACPALAAVRAEPRLGRAVDVPRVREALAADPLRQGARGALRLCLVLAPAFAVIAFALHTAVSARDREREFALLRALGARRRELAVCLWVEQVGLAGVAAVLGTLLGAWLAALVMPVVTVDAGGRGVFPPLALSVPWGRVGLTGAITAGVIFGVVALAGRVLGRVDLARVLRAGDGA